MKIKDAVAAFLAGDLIMVAEYRNHRAEQLHWRDKESGRQMEGPANNHGVEVGSVQVRVSERLPDGADVTKVVSPFKKGQRVLLRVTDLARVKGNMVAKGTLEPLDE